MIQEFDITPLHSRVPLNKNTAYFSQRLNGKDMVLKIWQSGDKMQLFGSGKKKKVSDILKDEKVSALEKTSYPVLWVDGDIIWIPGAKRSDLYRVAPEDKKMIKITYVNMEPNNN